MTFSPSFDPFGTFRKEEDCGAGIATPRRLRSLLTPDRRMWKASGEAGQDGVIVIWNTWFDAPVARKVLLEVLDTVE